MSSTADLLEVLGEPKLFRHCVNTYKLMLDSSIEKTDGVVFVGTVTDLIKELGLSVSYQSTIGVKLRRMGCITMIKRGGGAAKSVYMLHKEPTLEDFNATDDTGDTKYLKKAEDDETALQKIRDLNRRLQAVEDWAREQGGPF